MQQTGVIENNWITQVGNNPTQPPLESNSTNTNNISVLFICNCVEILCLNRNRHWKDTKKAVQHAHVDLEFKCQRYERSFELFGTVRKTRNFACNTVARITVFNTFGYYMLNVCTWFKEDATLKVLWLTYTVFVQCIVTYGELRSSWRYISGIVHCLRS